MSANTAIPVNLGFSVADGEHVKTMYDGASLTVTFTNWKEDEVSFICHDTLGYRWQCAEYFISKEERSDSVYEIAESDWLRLHQEQGQTWPETVFHHFKMNFNAAGIFEVLCSKITQVQLDGADNSGASPLRV